MAMKDLTDTCRVCGGEAKLLFEGVIMGKYGIKYFRCAECGFLQTERPFWLGEAYDESINLSDTGLVKRNLWLSNVTALVMFLLEVRKGKGLDYGGGYGLLVRLMRDKGFDYFWEDPWTENLFARGFEQMTDEMFDLVTCFEAFEHFVEPKQEIQEMLEKGRNILLSTQLLPKPVPHPNDWWYYDLDNGQHIAFYSRKTLEGIAKRNGLYLSTAWSVHLLSQKKVNNSIFKLLVAAGRLGLDRLLAPWLSSRTVRDMESLKENYRKRDGCSSLTDKTDGR